MQLLKLAVDAITGERTAKPPYVPEQLQRYLRRLVSELIALPKARKKAHRIWLKACASLPQEIPAYVHSCLAVEPCRKEMAEECFELLFKQDDYDIQLRKLTETLCRDRMLGRSQRIDYALQLVELLDRLTTGSGIAVTSKLQTTHFFTILNVFEPEKNVNQADMAAELMSYLRPMVPVNRFTTMAAKLFRHLMPQSTMIPIATIAYYVEVLVYARRFAEAGNIISANPKLTIGKEKEPAKDFLKRLSTSGRSRTAPKYMLDYQRIIKFMTKSWELFKK